MNEIKFFTSDNVHVFSCIIPIMSIHKLAYVNVWDCERANEYLGTTHAKRTPNI